MLYHLSLYLKNYINAFNVVHYVSFRVMASLLTALMFSFIYGSWFITFSKKFFRSKVRENTPQAHQIKNDTPTMGGIFIIMTACTSIFLWCNLAKPEVWIMMLCLIGFGAIGFLDDWLKIRRKKGISERVKFYSQIIVGITVVWLWFFIVQPNTVICIPFLKQCNFELGYLIIPWAVFLLVGVSNAVNLTDGLDGLAISSLISNFATFSILCYIAGHVAFSQYLQVPYMATEEIAVVASILVGASMGFLWYNAYPAEIFMGDVGSLALGASLALMAVMARQELLLALSGGLFMVETFSVIAQVLSFKFLGKRIFKMAPIHHHFELLGWPEAKITTRFGIISVVLCLMALMTLKLR